MRSSYRCGTALLVAAALSAVVAAPPVRAEGLTREQGDAILSELRQIRFLLERPSRPFGPGPQNPPPTPEKVAVKAGTGPALGRADAPVTIVEYADYECPACRGFRNGAFPEIRRNFIDTGKVRLVLRDLPLAIHPQAFKAAQAGRCAGDQGKFWEMDELLVAEPPPLTPESYARFARRLSLDAAAFQACMDGDRHTAEIQGSVREAASAGITRTPSFIVGTPKGDAIEGYRITGAQPYPMFEKVIRDLLAACAAPAAPACGDAGK